MSSEYRKQLHRSIKRYKHVGIVLFWFCRDVEAILTFIRAVNPKAATVPVKLPCEANAANADTEPDLAAVLMDDFVSGKSSAAKAPYYLIMVRLSRFGI